MCSTVLHAQFLSSHYFYHVSKLKTAPTLVALSFYPVISFLHNIPLFSLTSNFFSFNCVTKRPYSVSTVPPHSPPFSTEYCQISFHRDIRFPLHDSYKVPKTNRKATRFSHSLPRHPRKRSCHRYVRNVMSVLTELYFNTDLFRTEVKIAEDCRLVALKLTQNLQHDE